MTLQGKTLFITGGSRGIGLAIAVRTASEGANVVIAAKTDQENPRLPGTIYSAAEQIEAAGGQCLPLKVDIRDESQITEAVAAARQRFGSIDALINNASAISLTGTAATLTKRFDLMWQVNVRGTFVCTQACLPALKQSGERGAIPTS
jgi:citronellol/citronellal dehydrogenase